MKFKFKILTAEITKSEINVKIQKKPKKQKQKGVEYFAPHSKENTGVCHQ